MVVTLGILLIGGHFLVSVTVATHLSAHQSGWTFLLFMAFAASSGLVVTKIQTSLEMMMIRRHVKGRPNSGWKVIVAQKRSKKRSAPSDGRPDLLAKLKSLHLPSFLTSPRVPERKSAL